MTEENAKALRNIYCDASLLRAELRRAAKRCHRYEIIEIATPSMRERRDNLQDAFDSLCSLARQLSADVAAHLPATFKKLRQLDCAESSIPRPDRRNDPDGIHSERWDAIEAELREIRADAAAGSMASPHDAPESDGEQYSAPLLKQDIAKRFGITVDALRRWIDQGKIRTRDREKNTVRVHLKDLPK